MSQCGAAENTKPRRLEERSPRRWMLTSLVGALVRSTVQHIADWKIEMAIAGLGMTGLSEIPCAGAAYHNQAIACVNRLPNRMAN